MGFIINNRKPLCPHAPDPGEILYFTPNADKLDPSPIEVHINEELKSYFQKNFNASNEKITRVWIWKYNAFWWFPKWFGAYRELAIIESSNWYWSFERDDCRGIVRVQRDSNFDSLKHYYRGEKRTGTVVPLRSAEKVNFGNTMQDIFVWISKKDYLKDHLRKSNHFATLLYETIVRLNERKL